MVPAGYLPAPAGIPSGAHRLDDGTIRRIAGFLLVLGTLFMLDIVTTEIILLQGGMELNPFMIAIVSSPLIHLAVKAGILALVFWVSLAAEKRMRGSGVLFYGILIMMYLLVVANNILVLLPHVIRL